MGIHDPIREPLDGRTREDPHEPSEYQRLGIVGAGAASQTAAVKDSRSAWSRHATTTDARPALVCPNEGSDPGLSEITTAIRAP